MTTETHHQRVLIVDFGSQVTQLIARRVREAGVYCEIHPFDKAEALVDEYKPSAIILSGGPASVLEADSPRIGRKLFDLGLPMLAICYGQQLLCDVLGGKVEGGHAGEFGRAELTIGQQSPLFQGLAGVGELETVWMSHGDRVMAIPEGFEVIATSTGAPFAAIANDAKKIYAVQFHPEVYHTVHGPQMYRNFLFNVAGLKGDWTMASFRQEMVQKIRDQVGDGKVICGLSGGVDSSVAAVLIHEAIGDQLTCVFVDTGLLRYNEGDQVMAMFAEHMGVKVVRVNAADRYFRKLEGVSDPEAKRKIIGNLFVEIFDEESNKLSKAKWLAQGTIYPDVIESAGSKTGKAHVIKSHHNVGGLPEHMKLGLVEPLRELFKDEVRRLGVELGLPREMVYRHPFPGPGLGVRILGEVKREYAELLARADHIFIDELRKAGLYDKTSQAFAVFLPVKSVGVVGDARAYEWVIALRAVETIDFMTAHWAHLPYDFLGTVSNRIINELSGVSRVVYDISGKPPATIEWE